MLFQADLAGAGIGDFNDRAFYVHDGQQSKLRLRLGDQIPGTAPDTIYVEIEPFDSNSSQTILYRADAFGSDVDQNNFRRLYLNTKKGDTIEVARTDDPIPGDYFDYDGFLEAQINNDGTFALLAKSQSTSTPRAIVAGQADGMTSTVVAPNAPLPGADDVIMTGFRGLRLAETGAMSFSANLFGDDVNSQNNRALVQRGVDGEMVAVARTSDPLPALGEGVFLDQFESLWPQTPFSYISTDTGRLAFVVELEGPGVTNATDTALLGWDPDAGLFPLLREGDLVELSDGLSKTVEDVFAGFAAAEQLEHYPRVFGNQFVFSVEFTDGTFAHMTATIPSPGSMAATAMSVGFAMRRRRTTERCPA
jgi:hypothetical protein